MALSTALGFIGAGDVYLQAYKADGTLGPLLDTGNTTKLTIKPNSDRKQQISKKKATYGNPLTTYSVQKPAEISMTLETVNRANLRLAFMGEDAAYTQSAATITAEAFIARLDSWVQLANEAISGTGVVIKKGATSLVEGTDYILNRSMGLILILGSNTNSVADLDPLTAGYTAQAFTGAAIRGNVNPQIRAYLLLDGLNKVDDSIGVLKVWETVLSPTSEFDWFKDDFNTIDLAGTLNVPPGRTEPFRFYAR